MSEDNKFIEPDKLKASRFITYSRTEAFEWLKNNPEETLRSLTGKFYRLIHGRLNIYCSDHWESIDGPIMGDGFYHVFNEPEVVRRTMEEIRLGALVTTASKRLQRFEEAGRTLLFAKHEKKAYGETEVYKILKERGWKLLAEVLDEGGFV